MFMSIIFMSGAKLHKADITPDMTQIRLYIIYFDSTGGATALFSNYAAAVSETMQEPWRNSRSLSTV